MPTSRTPSQWLAATFLLVAAASHVPLVADHLSEAPYIGIGFILLIVACVVLAGMILLVGADAAWLLSGAVCLAAVLVFLASRTIGLPQLGDDVGNWTDPMGFPAVASELAVLALVTVHLRSRRTSPTPTT